MKTKINGNALTVYLEGEIDHHSAPSVRNSIDETVIMNSPTTVTLDFSSVSFMDSSGVGLIMGRYKLVSERGGSLAVCGLKPRDRRIVEMSGLKKLIEIR